MAANPVARMAARRCREEAGALRGCLRPRGGTCKSDKPQAHGAQVQDHRKGQGLTTAGQPGWGEISPSSELLS